MWSYFRRKFLGYKPDIKLAKEPESGFSSKEESMSFDKALKHTLKFEGGYVNDTLDRGGETNYGITIKTAKDHGYEGSMKNIPKKFVKEIYKKSYWDINKLDEVSLWSEKTALEVFDAGVNTGPSRAAKWLQASLNVLNRNEKSWSNVTEDGDIGSKTINTLNDIPKKDKEIFLSVLKGFRTAHYINLAHSSDHQQRFLRGWMSRL